MCSKFQFLSRIIFLGDVDLKNNRYKDNVIKITIADNITVFELSLAA